MKGEIYIVRTCCQPKYQGTTEITELARAKGVVNVSPIFRFHVEKHNPAYQFWSASPNGSAELPSQTCHTSGTGAYKILSKKPDLSSSCSEVVTSNAHLFHKLVHFGCFLRETSATT